MRDALIAILLCGAAVAACEVKDVPKAEAAIETAIETNWDDAVGSAAGDVNIQADIETGKVELKLPGGLEGTVKLPKYMGDNNKFDLEGIGRYPGAKLTSVDVRAGERSGDTARVMLGFAAPGSADAVADWYEQALVNRNRTALRTGNIITGTTKDGKPMVIAITDGSGGVARGRITITDSKG